MQSKKMSGLTSRAPDSLWRGYGAALCQAGLVDVQIRAAILALQDNHPYKRLPIQFADSLRERIVNAGILSVSELDNAIAECEQVAGDPETMVLSFIVTQV